MERVKQRKDKKTLAFWLLVFLLYLALTRVVIGNGVGGPIRLNYLLLFMVLLVVSPRPAAPAGVALSLLFLLADFALGQAKPWHLPWV
ncbi:MAG: hypothetical protein GX202_08865, partial [Firmicutes bacterium]|nr:hypothetical protein [Bacillota bacterium]